MFTSDDLKQFAARGIHPEKVEGQIAMFKSGISPVELDRTAVKDDGIEVLDEGGVLMYAGIYDKKSAPFTKIKFVPASGAASRMFKDLYSALENMLKDPYSQQDILENSPEIQNFFKQLNRFAFFDDLNVKAKNVGSNIQNLLDERKYPEILDLLLSGRGLNYGSKPKGVLKFHKYESKSLTPVEEHVSEAFGYLINKDKSLKLHLTVSPEHIDLFREISGMLTESMAGEGVNLQISYSVQEPSTDTIAVDLSNKPFRENDGGIHFRPGGHGALLTNLSGIEEDLIFIGNIDNVAPERMRPVRILYKKFLAGYLIEKLSIIRQLLNNLDTGFNQSVRNDILRFVNNNISEELANSLTRFTDEKFTEAAFRVLNRPVRVCGMVKNTGEPGGGPFWVKNEEGGTSKQIIEASQIDLSNSHQKEIFNSSTHFNPVDIVCVIKDFKGEKFDLENFRDDNMAFIAQKSAGGRELKALELPGLWNGSMAGWISFFAEVPIETFSPVKTVFDLIRPEHQS